ncbi:hypothetical protein [Nioella sp.]|uniref:hypothetical protein n=1 Tax=Nioella sp. TaxID=1912091 RepID=UPI0035125A0B
MFWKWFQNGQPSSRMWSSYKIGLNVLNERLNRNPDGSYDIPRVPELLSEAEEGSKSWKKLFEAKRLLIPKMTPEMIQAESIRGLEQAKAWDIPEAATYEANLASAQDNPKLQEAVYEQLVDSLQYHHYQRLLHDHTRSRTARNLNLVGVVVVGVAMIALIGFSEPEIMRFVVEYSFFSVMWFGMTGAYLSRMIAFQTDLNGLDHSALRINFSPLSLGVRMIVGALGAMIFYLLILGDLVGGEFFPELHGEQFLVGYSVFTEYYEDTAQPEAPQDGVASSSKAEDTLTEAETAQGEGEETASTESRTEHGTAADQVEGQDQTADTGGPDEEDGKGKLSDVRITLFTSQFAKLLIWATLAGFSERLLPNRLTGIATNDRKSA